MTPLKCFIAMAFDRKDTDMLYSSVIFPALKYHGICPLIVNRIEHNDNIDQKIIMLIKECDIAIVDLTYARPSVYFEAGFAECRVPVIYLVRKDHMKQKENDEYGNFIVHFDLKMRNIILWSEKIFPISRKNLEKRIRLVTKPLYKQRKQISIENEQSIMFHRLSQSDQLLKIKNEFTNALMKLSYEACPSHETMGEQSFVYSKLQRNILTVIGLSRDLSITQKTFRELYYPLDPTSLPQKYRKGYSTNLPKEIKIFRSIIFIFGLRKTSQNVLHNVRPWFQKSKDMRHMFTKAGNPPDAAFGLEIHICIVDGYPYESKYVSQALTMLNKIENND